MGKFCKAVSMSSPDGKILDFIETVFLAVHLFKKKKKKGKEKEAV